MKTQGFTLIEVMLALAILAVAFVPILRNIPTIHHLRGQSRYLFDCNNAAQSYMDRTLLKLESTAAGLGEGNNYTDVGVCFSPYTKYRFSILDETDGDFPGRRLLTVAAWLDRDQNTTKDTGEEGVTIRTYYMNRGGS